MSNPYDNNPYNRNQGGNMNNNPYGNRPQNMNQGRPMNPYGASRPVYPQPPVQAQTADNDKTTRTIIIVIGTIIMVAIIALVAVFAIKYKPVEETTAAPDTFVTVNINFSRYQDEFKSIEADYRDSDGNIPDSKLGKVLKKEYTYLNDYNSEHNEFTNINISDDNTYIYCTMPNGYTYYHYPNRGSYYEDDKGNRTDTDDNGSNSSNTADKLSKADYKDAAVELIYNFPKYGLEMNDTSISIELIDFDGDDAPEILYCDHYGSHGIPEIAKVYKFDGNTYKQISFERNDSSGDKVGNNYLPILPKKDSSGKRYFMSQLDSDFDGFENFPQGAFWYYYTAGVSEFTLEDNTLTSTSFLDFSDYRDVIEDSERDDEEREEAFENYKNDVNNYNDEYKVDDGYKYTCAWGIRTGFIDSSSLSEDEQLDKYHEVMTKEGAEYTVEQYENNNHEFNYSDNFSSNY